MSPLPFSQHRLLLSLTLVALYIIPSTSFTPFRSTATKRIAREMRMSTETSLPCDVTTLPGDPALVLTTSLDLGDKKLEVMKAISKAISENSGKPESFIAVSINDKVSMIFGGSDAPTALGTYCSIGAISKEINGGITKDVTEILEPFGLTGDRIYINFFDVPRANCGWNKTTFAG